jgi:adenylate kinase
LITADTDEVVRRLLNRAQEQGRADDTEDVIRRRLEVYAEQTAPLINVYSKRNLVIEVDGLGAVAEVTARILEALASRGIEA